MDSACLLTPKREFLFPCWIESCSLERVIFFFVTDYGIYDVG